MTFRVLRCAPAPGDVNMRSDEEMAARLAGGSIPPTLRLYGWDPPAVSIGYHQAEDDFDPARLRDAGIGLVRRPTGGRAILHWHELTYCAVVPVEFASPREAYRLINEALLAGVRQLGIDASLSPGGGGLRDHVASASGVPCFSFSVKSEIQCGGKKLVGSAQRKYPGVILQHGSFLLGPQHRRLTEFLAAGGTAAKDVIDADISSRTTEAETVLGRPVSFDEAARAVEQGFTGYFGPGGHAPSGALPHTTTATISV